MAPTDHQYSTMEMGPAWRYGVTFLRPEWNEWRQMRELRMAGEEGWELVGVVYNPFFQVLALYFKQPVYYGD